MEIISTLTNNPLMRALLILVLSVLFAFLAKWLFAGILHRMVRRTSTSFDDKILDLLNRPVFFSIFLIGFNFALQSLNIPKEYNYYLVGIIKTIAVFIWTSASFKFVTLTFKHLSLNPNNYKFIQKRTLSLFDNFGKIIVFSGTIYFLFLIWNINITAWLASAGIVGIAIGFAAKDSLANLFAGLFIMVDSPYKIGDFINLDGGERGRVTNIGLRSTRMLTRDDIEITIPNSVIASSKIINESGGPNEMERIRIGVGVAYGSDIDLVRETLLKVAIDNEYVQADPEPRIRFREFAESELSFQLLCWIEEPILRGRVLDQLNSEIYKKFNEKGIVIPFPQRTIYMAQSDKEN